LKKKQPRPTEDELIAALKELTREELEDKALEVITKLLDERDITESLTNKINSMTPVEGAIDKLRISLERKIANIADQLDSLEDVDITDPDNEFIINLIKTWTKEGAAFRKSLDFMESGEEKTERDDDFDLEAELLKSK
jgi:hypothetical protein